MSFLGVVAPQNVFFLAAALIWELFLFFRGSPPKCVCFSFWFLFKATQKGYSGVLFRCYCPLQTTVFCGRLVISEGSLIWELCFFVFCFSGTPPQKKMASFFLLVSFQATKGVLRCASFLGVVAPQNGFVRLSCDF